MMLASIAVAFCPAMLTNPVCWELLPHCGQKGASDGIGAKRNPTVIVAGEPDAPGALIVMWPVFTLGARVPAATEICKVSGAVPLVGVTESHDESLEAVNASVPSPILETLTEAGEGFTPLPCVAEKERLVCESEREGVSGGGSPAPLLHPAQIELMIATNKSNAKRFIGRPAPNHQSIKEL